MKVQTLMNIRPGDRRWAVIAPELERAAGCFLRVRLSTQKSAILSHSFCKLQSQVLPGDVGSVWPWRLLDSGHVYLMLDFQRPVPNKITVQFNVSRQGGLVSGILATRAVYLQPSLRAARCPKGSSTPLC